MEFKGAVQTFITDTKQKQSASPAGGLMLDLILPRNNRKWMLHNELLYTSFKSDFYYGEYVNPNSYSDTYGAIGFSYVKLVNMLRYKYPIGNSFIYLNAGITNGFIVSEKNNAETTSVNYGPPKTKQAVVLAIVRKYEQGYTLGIGTGYKKFSIEARYEAGNGMSDLFC